VQEYAQQQEKIALKNTSQDGFKETTTPQNVHSNVSSPRQQVIA
jgi:hypothetical protein